MNEHCESHWQSRSEFYVGAGLGLDKTHWSRWSKENIIENELLTQHVNFIRLIIMASAENPNPPKDYAVTINIAKHIAMIAKTQQAHDGA